MGHIINGAVSGLTTDIDYKDVSIKLIYKSNMTLIFRGLLNKCKLGGKR
jgi:hypothetical protein